MNKEHFFVASDGQGSSDVGSAYNSNNVSSSLTSSRGGSGFSRSSNSNNSNNNTDSDTSTVSEGTAGRSSGFFGLENLSQEKSFCLFNASKSYLNCLSICAEEENKSCDYKCGNKALDDVRYCIYYEEPQEEEVEEEEEIVTTMSSLERMEKLDGSVYMPYAVYDTNILNEEYLVNLKLKNGIQFAQLSPEYKKPGGQLVNTETPYLLWGR